MYRKEAMLSGHKVYCSDKCRSILNKEKLLDLLNEIDKMKRQLSLKDTKIQEM